MISSVLYEKEDIRKEYFKLRIKGHTNNQCRKILFAKFSFETNIRTLRRWTNKLNNSEWNLKDKSKRPNTIHYKINSDVEKKVIDLRNKTGFGENKLEIYFTNLSHKSINKILRKYKLTNPSERKKKRIKYVRWQRDHVNSLWQIDHSDQKIDDKWVVSVIDDHSRKNLAFTPVNRVTTAVVVKIIDDLTKIYGKPKQILSDNGSAYGLKSKHSKFDTQLRKREIEHIRGAIHSPTTTGKVERLFQTYKREIKFCNNDPELWRMRYNHFRPHTSLNDKTPDEVYNDFRLLS
jgi:transposase InsO family protein